MFFKRLTSLVGMALWAGLSLCAQDVRISYEAVGKNYLLKADNTSYYPYTIQIMFTKLTGASALSQGVPYIYVSGHGSNRLLTLKRETEEVPIGFAYQTRIYKGNWKMDSDSSYVYLPPVAPGKEVYVRTLTALEDFFRKKKPTKVTGLAFRMNEGDTVYAMRGGLVCEVCQHQASDALQKEKTKIYARTENYVVVYHKDGSFATYKLFKENGVFVKPGDKVEAGMPLGVIGAGNYSQGSHLRVQMSGCFRDSDKEYAIEGRGYHSFVPVLATDEKKTCKPYPGTVPVFTAQHPQSLIMKEMTRREKQQYLKNLKGKR